MRWNNYTCSITCCKLHLYLTLVLLHPDIPCLCKQCRSRSVGFWRSQLIWICTVCHYVCEFIATIRIKWSDWLKIRSGCGILIYSAGQGLIINVDNLWKYNTSYRDVNKYVIMKLIISTKMLLYNIECWKLLTYGTTCLSSLHFPLLIFNLTLVLLNKLISHAYF